MCVAVVGQVSEESNDSQLFNDLFPNESSTILILIISFY